MNTAIERLLTVRVVDAMSRDVVSISANATIAEAAATFLQHNISGAPVVNELGHCVGILSATDLVKAEHSQGSDSTSAPPADEFQLVNNGGHDSFHIDRVANELVSAHMSSAPQTIHAEQSLIDAARYMDGEHIHRLVVLDEHAHPLGVISSLDIVSALVKTVEEHESDASLKS